MLVDIGVNLMSPAFDSDRQAVLETAESAGVKKFIITGSSLKNSLAASEYVTVNSLGRICMTTAGIHPHNAKDWNTTALSDLKKIILHSDNHAITIAAVGECGLDFNRNFSTPQKQRECFEGQLALATELGKPVFLHERDAFDDFFSILKHYRPHLPGAVVHCFTGGKTELEAYLALDCYIGITGWICDERRGSHLIPLLKQIPSDRLLLETDSPYLLPRSLPHSMHRKSGRNEPCFLPHIASFTASILGKTPEQIGFETSANAERLFGGQICPRRASL